MPRDEGLALFALRARTGRAHASRTWLEVGAWCGKSALYLGAAAEATQERALLTRPPSRQRGEPGGLGALRSRPSSTRVDGRLNTLPTWQRTIADARLRRDGRSDSSATPPSSLVTSPSHSTSSSSTAGTDTTPPGPTTATGRPRSWSAGCSSSTTSSLTPRTGGRPPYEIYLAALESTTFVDVANEGSLRALRRVSLSEADSPARRGRAARPARRGGRSPPPPDDEVNASAAKIIAAAV